MNIVTLDLPPKGEEQRMLIETTFYYLRHGETDWNRQRRFQGQVDNPLNAVGAEQARAASEQVRNIEIKAIYASPLRRAIETARYFQTALGCRLDVIDITDEISHGDIGRGELFGESLLTVKPVDRDIVTVLRDRIPTKLRNGAERIFRDRRPLKDRNPFIEQSCQLTQNPAFGLTTQAE